MLVILKMIKTMKKLIYKFAIAPVVLGLGIFWLGGCSEGFSGARYDTEDKMQIYDYVKQRADLSTYQELLDYTLFNSLMSTAGSYTAFIPTNDAFQKLFKRLNDKGIKINSIQDGTPEYWLDYLKYMTLEKSLNSNTYENGILDEPTMMGEDYYIISDIRASYSAIKLNSYATIRESNIKMANGLIQVIDEVLLPPTNSVYDMMVEAGVYTKMLKVFDDNGLTSYLKDSVVTVIVEPDYVLEAAGVNPDTIQDIGNWAAYHVFYGQRSFSGELSGLTIYPMYREEAITFRVDKEGKLWCNTKFGFSQELVNGIDNVAANGVFHVLDTVLAIVEAPPGVKRHNLYAQTKMDGATVVYEQNVFTDAPAKINEDFGSQSYHQGKKTPICGFDAQQIGDYFHTKIPDVVSGKYQVRMIYRTGTRADLMMIYNDKIVSPNVNMNTPATNWPEWTSIQYRDMGEIVVDERGSVELFFQVVKLNRTPSACCDLLMDMIELRPVAE